MKAMCKPVEFRVAPGSRVDLGRWPTEGRSLYSSRKRRRRMLEECHEELRRLQSVLYAHDRYAMLLIFQGMDTAGKDGAISHVFSGLNPQGCQVFSFKEPSSEELDHDFLWRTNMRLPERGRIGIFNRSYYEEVLVVRVRPDVLARQRIPAELVDPRTLWKERYRDIVRLEDYLHRNGTRIVKFFLHLSKEEQRRRLLERIDDREKNWKVRPSDLETRELWNEYRSAYAECLGATSTARAPWYVVPADDKWNARLIISRIIIEAMRRLKMSCPEVSGEQRRAIRRMRKSLVKEKG